MFFIMQGRVEQVHTDADGNEVVESCIGPGGAVGTLAAYFGIRYLYSVRATALGGPCLCLKLVRHQLMPIIKAYPDDEEMVAQNAMLEFQKVRQDKSVNGRSATGRSAGRSIARSGKSGRASVHSHNAKLMQDTRGMEQVGDNASLCDGTEQSLQTAYEVGAEMDEQHDKGVDTIVMTGIEQRLASLNQRRKAERVAQMCSAASRGEIDKLGRSMRNGVHIDETDVNGRTALHCAASEGKLEAVRYLIASRASVNIRDGYKNTPLNDAVRSKHDQVANELRKSGASNVTLPGFEMGVLMCTFAHNGDQASLERLIHNRVDVNISDYDQRTALHLACCQGHADLVGFLLDKNADVNCTDRMGFSPLVDALRHGQLQVQELLRARGGQLHGMALSVELCECAANGNVPRIKVFTRSHHARALYPCVPSCV